MRHLLFAAVWLATTGSVNAGAATLAIHGRANATPSVAAANQFVVVAWGATDETEAGTTDVYLAISRDGGRTFGPAVRVSDERHASLGAEQPPRVALVPHAGRDPEVVVVWTAKSTDGSRLLISRSQNGGTSFTRAAPIPGSEAAGNRGWESIALDRDGQVMAVWLDHREMASPGSSAMHHEGHDHGSASAPKADGAVRAQSSKLYFTTLDGASSPHAVTGGVCYCCKTAVATGPDGAVYAAWRHVYPGNLRDMAFTMSRDGGRTFATPVRVSNDGWILDGCPENGPALAVGADNVVHVLWPTLVAAGTLDGEPALALFHATVRNGGTFSPRERIATEGTPRHPQLTAMPAGVVAAWDEQEGGGSRRVVLARLTSRGSGPAHVSREIVSSNVRAQTPAIAATPDAVVIAWSEGTERSTIHVERR